MNFESRPSGCYVQQVVSPAPHLPDAIRAKGVLHRWLWTLCPAPGQQERDLVRLTGALQPQVSRALRQLQADGLVHQEKKCWVRTEFDTPPAPLPAAIKRCFHQATLAHQLAAKLSSPQHPLSVYRVKVAVLPYERRGLKRANNARGTTYVVAHSPAEIPALIEAQSKNAALYDFSDEQSENFPSITLLPRPQELTGTEE